MGLLQKQKLQQPFFKCETRQITYKKDKSKYAHKQIGV